MGEEGPFESLAEQNIQALSGCEFTRIVTSDPHSLNTLRNEYPALGGSWEVVHRSAAAPAAGASGSPTHLDRSAPRKTGSAKR